jgi:phosphoglycolate phosphatase
MNAPDALIFDLDGTLVDSLADIASALNHGLSILGLPTADRQSVRRWIGDGLPTLCRRALPDERKNELDRLIFESKTYYESHCAVETRLYPKVLKTLDLLQERGVPMSVLSNKPHALTLLVVQSVGVSGYFISARGSLSDADRKPSAKMALEIAAEMGCTPASICLIGDSPVDVQTARNAGMISAAVTWGFRDGDELKKAGPDHLIDYPEKIFSLL